MRLADLGVRGSRRVEVLANVESVHAGRRRQARLHREICRGLPAQSAGHGQVILKIAHNGFICKA